MNRTALLEVEGLTVSYPARRWGEGERVMAVRDVSFAVRRGEALGLVGETGCGKSSIAQAVLQLIDSDAGSIRFDGVELRGLPARRLRALRKRFQPLFQDPMGSLDPTLTVMNLVGEGLAIHRLARGREREAKVQALLEQLGLPPDAGFRYPHELSGGERQRIGLARALAVEPELLIADEPLSALDALVQAHMLNLLLSLQKERGLAYLFISHDLLAVGQLCQRMAVMYQGRIVEMATSERLPRSAHHPYTQALWASMPRVDGPQPTAPALDVPPVPAQGCPYAPRCPRVMERCREQLPALTPIREGHLSACFLPPT